MAQMIANRSLVSHLSFAAIAAQAGNAVQRIWTVLVNRRAVASLHEFDDRMLKDIGLVRSDVVAALDSPLDQDPSLRLARVAAGRSRHGL